MKTQWKFIHFSKRAFHCFPFSLSPTQVVVVEKHSFKSKFSIFLQVELKIEDKRQRGERMFVLLFGGKV